MEPNQYKRILREGDINILHKDYKGIEWAEEELERIKGISDLEERKKEAEKVYLICDNVYCLLVNNIPDGVSRGEPYGLNQLLLVCDGLCSLKNKPNQSTPNPNPQNKNYSTHCSFCNNKSKIYHLIYNKVGNYLQWSTTWNAINSNELVFCNKGCFDEWWKTNYSENEPIKPEKPTNTEDLGDNYKQDNYEPTDNDINETCAECRKSLQVGDEYYHKKNDNKKLCSTDCYDKYYKNEMGKTELKKKEEVFNAYETIQKELFEKFPVVSPEEVSFTSADVVYKTLEKEQEKDELQSYLQQKLAEIRNVRSNKSNSNHDFERERTRTQQTNLRTVIQQLEAKPTRTSQEEQELTRKKKELEQLEQRLKELEKERKNNQNSQSSSENRNLGVKIGIGVGIVGIVLIGLIVIIKIKKWTLW